jgi:hypothetical protein
MKKTKKRYITTFSLFVLIGSIVAIIIIVYPHLFKKYTIPKTVDVFGPPIAKAQQNFPASNPAFTAIIGDIKPASLRQQSIIVYRLKNAKKTPVFERPFYADGFRGNELTYTFASNSAEITQNGSIGSLGCSDQQCSLLWSNYYTWNQIAQMFVLTNIRHKSEFQYLLADYQALDQKGCSLMKGKTIAGQDGLSFTELYKKYPTANYYCSQEQGILPSNIIFFLQSKKALTQIVSGENIGSNEIRDISL